MVLLGVAALGMHGLIVTRLELLASAAQPLPLMVMLLALDPKNGTAMTG